MSSSETSNAINTYCHYCGNIITGDIEDRESFLDPSKYVCENKNCISIDTELSQIENDWYNETQKRYPDKNKIKYMQNTLSHFK
jgi:aspartate carbamoyltransferase regulatory subunit